MANINELLAGKNKTWRVQPKVDVRDVATIVKWMKEECGVVPRAKTEIVEIAVALLINMLKKRYPDHVFDNTELSLVFLDSLGLGPTGVARKAANQAISKENEERFNDQMELEMEALPSVDPEALARALEIHERREQGLTVDEMTADELAARRKEKDEAQRKAMMAGLPAGLVVKNPEENS